MRAPSQITQAGRLPKVTVAEPRASCSGRKLAGRAISSAMAAPLTIATGRDGRFAWALERGSAHVDEVLP
jgi:hypothetical protein